MIFRAIPQGQLRPWLGGLRRRNENCSVDDLAVGVVVHEAELEASNGQAVFTEIELAQ